MSDSPMHALVRRIGLGRIAYRLWHRPIDRWRKCRAEGFASVRETNRGREAMKRAAAYLPTFPPSPNGAPEVVFLSGRAFWFQTAFCAASLRTHSSVPIRIVVQDDGSLTREQAHSLATLFPGSRLQTAADATERLDRALPAGRFPTLRAHRIPYPHLRKLTDVHAGTAEGWKIVLDSDMLFWREPTALLEWLESANRPFHMRDCETSYGYPPQRLEALCGNKVADRVNVGMTGLDSGAIDWERVELWTRELLETDGPSYYLEQALIAMILAGVDCVVPAAEDYLCLPSEAEVASPTATLHHYVAESKRWYFRTGWQRALAAIERRSAS